MKYSLNFYRRIYDDNQYDFNEIIIEYKEDNSNVVDFAKEKNNGEKRLILDMTKFDKKFPFMTISMLQEAHPNLAVRLSLEQLGLAPDLAEANISFFFDTVADTWDYLLSLIYVGVSDIYVGNELGFEITEVAKICHKHNVNVRVYPNVAQTSAPLKNMNGVNSFFIRPEDLKRYEQLVDIIEFFGPADRQGTLYRIYKRGTWEGELNELIIGLSEKISNPCIAPLFGEGRLSCHKRCLQDKCKICFHTAQFARSLSDANLRIKENKNDK